MSAVRDTGGWKRDRNIQIEAAPDCHPAIRAPEARRDAALLWGNAEFERSPAHLKAAAGILCGHAARMAMESDLTGEKDLGLGLEIDPCFLDLFLFAADPLPNFH